MPQNQAHVLRPIDGTDPTLLFVFVDVDTQRDFMEPGGAMHSEGAERFTPRILQLMACAMETGMPVISTVDAHPPDDAEFESHPPHGVVGSRGAEKVEGTVLEGAVRLTSEPGQQISSPPPAQVIVEKQTLDAFRNPNLAPLISTIYGRTAVIFGTAIDCCVKDMCVKLRARGLPCRVVTDACPAIDEGRRAASEREIIESGALIVKTDEIIAQVRARAADLSSAG